MVQRLIRCCAPGLSLNPELLFEDEANEIIVTIVASVPIKLVSSESMA